MNLKVIPVLFALAFLLVPPMSSYAVNPTVEFEPEVRINDVDDVDFTYVFDIAVSEDKIHWIFSDEAGSDFNVMDKLYYQNSNGGSDETQILISDNSQWENRQQSTIHAWDDYVLITYAIDDGGTYDDLRAVLSTDNGATFGTEYHIFDNDYDNGNNGLDIQSQGATIVTAEDGDLYLFWYYRLVDDIVQMLHSTDNGLTWTDKGGVGGFEQITNDHYFSFIAESGIHVEGNTIHLALGGYDNNEGVYMMYYNRSDDDGTTWLYEEPDLIQVLSTTAEDQDEYTPDIEVNGDNILITWSGYENSDLEYAYSTDGGDTFNTENLIVDGCGNYGQPQYDWATSSVGDFAVYGCTGSPASLWTTSDFGATWDSGNTIGYSSGSWHSDSSSDTIAFVSSNSTGSTLFYAQNPTSFADFDQVTVFTATNGGSFDVTPHVAFTTDGIYVTRTHASSANFGFYFAPYGSEPDVAIPVITPNESEPITLLQGSSFNAFEHVTCTDDIDGVIVPNGNFGTDGGITVDTSVRGSQTQDYDCTDSSDNTGTATIQYLIKKVSSGSGGGSSSSSGDSFTQSTIDTLENTPPLLQFTPQDGTQDPRGTTFADLFANLFDNRLGLDGETVPQGTPASQSQGATTAPSQRPNPITEFLTNLFSGFFN